MQKAQVVRQIHAQKNGQPGKSEKNKPLRYFVEGRIPPDVAAAQKRLTLIKEEHKRASNLVNNATDINNERHNCRKRFLEHTEKEIMLLTEWIDNNTWKTSSTKNTQMSAREKILDTLNFLIALDKKGLLLAKEAIVLDMLVDYGAQG